MVRISWEALHCKGNPNKILNLIQGSQPKCSFTILNYFRMNSFDCSNHTAPQNKMMKDKMDRTVVSRLGLHTINREWDES